MSMQLAARVWHLKLDKTTMLLLMAMCDSADDDGTGCIASEDFLIWKTGVSRAQFYRVRAALEEKGITHRHTLADGRVETTIFLDKVPQKPAWKRPKRGGARPHKKGANTIKGSHGEIKGSHGEIKGSHGETDTNRTRPESVSDGGALFCPIHPIEPSYYPSSLARSVENAAADSPSEGAAPPDRRARERLDTSALKRDPLFIALVACLGREPLTRREWWQWRTAVNELHSVGVHAAAIPTAIKGFQLNFPRASVTPLALVNQWSLIREGKSRDIAQLEIARRESAAKAERERAEQERREQEHAAVLEYLSAEGYEISH